MLSPWCEPGWTSLMYLMYLMFVSVCREELSQSWWCEIMQICRHVKISLESGSCSLSSRACQGVKTDQSVYTTYILNCLLVRINLPRSGQQGSSMKPKWRRRWRSNQSWTNSSRIVNYSAPRSSLNPKWRRRWRSNQDWTYSSRIINYSAPKR